VQRDTAAAEGRTRRVPLVSYGGSTVHFDQPMAKLLRLSGRMLRRILASRLPSPAGPRRLVVLTGARQVGKTTLARALYREGLRYLNLDSPGERERLRGVPAEGWARERDGLRRAGLVAAGTLRR
jgi:hypothetical protein